MLNFLLSFQFPLQSSDHIILINHLSVVEFKLLADDDLLIYSYRKSTRKALHEPLEASTFNALRLL